METVVISAPGAGQSAVVEPSDEDKKNDGSGASFSSDAAIDHTQANIFALTVVICICLHEVWVGVWLERWKSWLARCGFVSLSSLRQNSRCVHLHLVWLWRALEDLEVVARLHSFLFCWRLNSRFASFLSAGEMRDFCRTRRAARLLTQDSLCLRYAQGYS